MENGRNAALNGGRGSGQTVRRITTFYEEKIADLKANFDYILEGKENEYREERKKLCDDFENMKAGLESKIATLGKRCNQLLKDKGELTDKIADIKANCDFAIEGRDIKIKELEQQIEKMKSCANCKHQCSFLFQDEIDCANNGLPKWEIKEND